MRQFLPLNRVTSFFTLQKITTVDTRLQKTKHPRIRFQNFRQSCVLLINRSKSNNYSHQSDLLTFSTSCYRAVIGGFRSDLSLTRKTAGNFWKRFRACFFSKLKSRTNENGGKTLTTKLLLITLIHKIVSHQTDIFLLLEMGFGKASVSYSRLVIKPQKVTDRKLIDM